MIVIYTCILSENIETNRIFDVAKKMPPSRYQEFLNVDSQSAKIQKVIAYLLLRKALEDVEIDHGNLDFSYTVHGKPYFRELPIEFSISHSNEIVAVVLDQTEVGLDVEKLREVNPRLVNKVFSLKERKKFSNHLLDKNIFCKAWTIKESYTKCLGEGLYVDFSTLSFDLSKDINCINNLYINSFKIRDYYVSVCSRQIEYQIKYIKIQELL